MFHGALGISSDLPPILSVPSSHSELAVGSYSDSFAHTFVISLKMCKSTFHLSPGALLGSWLVFFP